MKYSLFDTVSLTEDIPEYNLKSGMIGAIIDVYTKPDESYEVEFCDENGRTIEILALSPDKLSKVS
ncbi:MULTISPECIES: DUF4926 domain-containing protein [Snodgrassella]|uniref:DUF4926 domain-containing protein n=2 Tax=Snodgrassella alvi TaxID=1196083 RepID=A0ABD7Z207_9NEIS|nr:MULTISPECIES: DUF4926 domain-containing protein [Snodgrassella]KEQ01438.1 hypothetical protein SASC598J21_007780 [Snodgrassella alvi SCGC AB-598-J21]KES11677.1 hypothetical protein SASC598O11_005440 [Snodgrassella alvi SCGC AB-598-O11]KES11831.1 hypothetical protein SASC598P14_001180 [Snodgrassella alvi SCGC AB-598-P14]KES12174.1 hypothetical protein SASC598P14_002090 [Snodgrassella alvi SCGC AB-598-P14]KES12481.1 hypothetical protein SASC598P14_003050 [Snodgrassella alvi SCGC AB-598-P14]